MMLLVHSSPTTLEPYRHSHLGILSSPRRWYKQSEGIEDWKWAADNDAYSQWDPKRYREMLNSIWGLKGCLFVTAPDVVGDSAETRRLFQEWYVDLMACLQPVAFVAQDRQRAKSVPWQSIDALFIGGSTRFKMGEDAQLLVREALRRDKWVHMGRVNSLRRIRYAKAIGCHSVDGGKYNQYRDVYLKQGLGDVSAMVQEIMA